MFKTMSTEFTDEEVCVTARIDLTSVIFAVIHNLKTMNLDIEAFWYDVGLQFAPAWEFMREDSVFDIAQKVGLDMTSAWAEVVSLTGNEERARLIVTNWPPENLRNLFQISEYETDEVCETFRPIMEHLDLMFEWYREGDNIVLTFER